MVKRILVGTDFSPAGDRAVRAAAAWARSKGAALRVMHVVPPKRWLVGLWQTDLSTVSAIHRHAGAALRKLTETLDPARQLEISTGVVSGAASVELARAARDFEADLFVVGTRGEHEVRSSQPSLGGTSLKLLATSPSPLLLVRTESAEAPASVLAAVDLSPLSHDVLAAGLGSLTSNGRLSVFHAYEAPFAARLNAYGLAASAIDFYTEGEQQKRQREIESLITSLAAGTNAQLIVERGDPIDLLLQHIGALEPDLVVVGKHTRRGRRPASWSGSVSRHMAFFAPTNVLIVPPPPASETLQAEGAADDRSA